jgi:hypothetical protein
VRRSSPFSSKDTDPPSDSLTAAKMQAQQRFKNYLQNVARNMNGDARAALGELTNRG